MDIISDLKRVSNLDEYITVTQDIVSKHSKFPVLFNMSTVLLLKKVKTLEIDYFNKFNEHGAAVIIFKLILRHPPSKTWALLGKELISLIKYWFEVIRKRFIFNNNRWWNFTNTLIAFIESICVKSKTLHDVIVQETCECLLDLATHNRTDLNQSYEIIRCFNACCAESSRTVRIALKTKLDIYLARVAGAVRASRDARVQLAGTQALVRWTVGRARRDARAAAAAAWLAPHAFPPRAVAAFVDAAWTDYPQDARRFLNALNEEGSTVVSLRCRSCTSGGVELVTASGGEHWLDASAGSRSLALHRAADDDALLLLRDDDVQNISLHGAGGGAVVAVVAVAGAAATRAVLGAGPRALRRLHALLRAVFAHRYTAAADFDSMAETKDKSEENEDSHAKARAAGDGGYSGRAARTARTARGERAARTARAGYLSQQHAPPPPLSPSSASTSSLLMLRAKLSAFPGAVYDKEPGGVCAAPQLSDLTEATEPDLGPPRAAARPGAVDTSGSSRDTRQKIAPSPVAEDDGTDVSLLLVAATASADDSAGDEPPAPRDAGAADIVDLLALEALGSARPPAAPPAPPAARGPTIVSDTTDDSAADYVENTPLDVLERGPRRSNEFGGDRAGGRPSFDSRDVENFFARHLAENGDRDVVVSPALARRINRSSSGSSAGDVGSTPSSVDDGRGVDRDVLDCLTKMLDEVCQNLDRCVGHLRADERRDATPTIEDVAEPSGAGPSERRVEGKAEAASKKIKLKFPSRSPRVARRGGPRRRRDASKPAPRSTRVENENRDPAVNPTEVIREKRSKNSCNEAPPCKTPQTRRKRKLYSPKDVVDDSDSYAPRESEADGRKKSLDTPYKEIENIRNKSLIESRKKIRTPLSTLPPRAQKLNDIFDGLKNTIEGERNITLVARNTRNRGAVYNFPSDSDDEDFRAKENAVARGTGRGKKRPTGKPPAGRTRGRPARRGAKGDRPPVRLERARAAPPSPLEISFDAERPGEPAGDDPEPAGTSKPEMEVVGTDGDDGDAIEKRSARPRRKRWDPERTRESRGSNIPTSGRPADGDVTGSPLPGLVVEEIPAADDVNAASICTLEGLDITADRFPLDRRPSSPAETRLPSRRSSPAAPSVAASSGSRAGKKRQLSTRKRKPGDAPVKRCPRIPAPETRASTDDADRRAVDSDAGSERSIPTLGKSPITAHGDVDEAPPSARLLARPLTERRAIEAVHLSGTLRAYYDDLAGEIERPPADRGDSPATARSRGTGGGSVWNLSPVVLVARLSPDVVGGWTPARLASARSSSDDVASRPTSRGVASDALRERISTISPILPFGDGDAGRGRTSGRSRGGSGAAKEPARPDRRKTRSRRSGSTPSSGGYDLRSGRRSRAGAASPAEEVAPAPDDVESESQIDSEDSPSPAGSRSPKRRRVSAGPARADAASAVSEWVWRSARDASPQDVAGEGEGEGGGRARAAVDAVLEKLDTTLQEIHHNTSTKLVGMFVEVGRGAAALRADRERLYRAAVRDVLVEVVAIIDAKFTDLERRCGEAEAAWERGVRAAARGVLRDDCRQKRDLLALLRDDLRDDLRAAPHRTAPHHTR